MKKTAVVITLMASVGYFLAGSALGDRVAFDLPTSWTVIDKISDGLVDVQGFAIGNDAVPGDDGTFLVRAHSYPKVAGCGDDCAESQPVSNNSIRSVSSGAGQGAVYWIVEEKGADRAWGRAHAHIERPSICVVIAADYVVKIPAEAIEFSSRHDTVENAIRSLQIDGEEVFDGG